jgi:hypothetical protein
MLGNQSNNRRIPLGRNVDPAGVASDGEAPASCCILRLGSGGLPYL